MNSGYDSDLHNDHLRRLLDQRAARAGHGRFPSLSEFSDSPSIYSHAQFSPRPVDRSERDATGNAFHYTVFHPAEPRTPMSDRQRLNIPEASSLDLDDDTRSSDSFTTHNDDDDDDSATEEAGGDDPEAHRVSAYGPKMTVHSRAPWETGEDDTNDTEEQAASKRRAFTFAKKDNNKRIWGKDARIAGSIYPRPSLDSLQSRGKQSFETTSTSSQVSAGGALVALAQASMSSTSLGLSPSPQASLREKLSLPRFRSRTPTGNRLEAVDSRQPRYRAASPAASDYSRTDSHPSSSNPPSPRTPSHQNEYHHPYANPELVRNYTRNTSPHHADDSHNLSAPHSPAQTVSRSESTATVTESTTATTLSTLMQSQSDATIMTPGTSVSSIAPAEELKNPTRGLAVSVDSDTAASRGRGEAGGQDVFVYDRSSGFPSPVALTPSWPQSPFTNPIKLISLEEAQAQARERSRSATATAVPSSPAPTLSSKFPDSGLAQSGTHWSRLRSASGSNGKPGRGFTSASTADLHNPPHLPGEASSTFGGTSQRTIGRKKSGFMRLFNSKEKAPSSLPPVPSISADMTAPMIPVIASPHHRARKQSAHRVPVPSFAPSVLGVSERGSSSYSDSPSDDAARSSSSDPPPMPSVPRERQLSSRRNAPGLSIVTSSNPPPLPLKSPVGSDMLRDPFSTKGDGFSKAATPSPRDESKAEFVALSLRPVSTTFSADFAGQLGSPGRPSLDVDMGTPTTGASAISPRSPPLSYKLDDANSAPFTLDSHHEDPSAVIRLMQDQIAATRKMWQQQLWELETQVHDLKEEVEELRANEDNGEYCSACGRGSVAPNPHQDGVKRTGTKAGGVVNRPRARTGTGTRFASAT